MKISNGVWFLAEMIADEKKLAEFFFFPELPSEADFKSTLDDWAKRESSRGWVDMKINYRRVNAPTDDWLRREINNVVTLISHNTTYLQKLLSAREDSETGDPPKS